MNDGAIFKEQGGSFVAELEARSGWPGGQLHGGPVAALLAREIMPFVEQEWHVARFVVNLFRAVPSLPMQTSSTVARDGRRIRVIDATLTVDGEPYARATALLLRQTGDAPPPASARQLPAPAGLAAEHLREGDRNEPSFHRIVEFRNVPASEEHPLPATWVRIPVRLLATEELTPFVRFALTLDFMNRTTMMAAMQQLRIPHINADLSAYLHRPMSGEWIGLELTSLGIGSGILTGSFAIHDEAGIAGRGTVVSVANPRAVPQDAPTQQTKERDADGG